MQPEVPRPPPMEGAAPAPAAPAALLRLRAALALFAAGALIGGPWDMLWHTEHVFESFFSPPHLFIYGMTAAAVAVVASIALTPPLRGAFGRAARVPLTGIAVPPALLFLGGGLLVILTAGVLDEAWHAAFGADETRFSAPHAMFGWGLFVATLGFAGARLALRPGAPVGTLEAVVLGFLLLSFSLYAFLLPFLVYPTEGTLQAIASLPAIQAQPAALHTFRIYTSFDIERGNLWFAPLACLWGGVSAALVAGLDGARRTPLASTAAASAVYVLLWYGLALRLGTQGDPRTWLPLPVLPAVAALALAHEFDWEPVRSHLLGAVVFGGLVLLTWSQGAIGGDAALSAAVLGLCAVVFVAGHRVGAALASVVARPRRASVVLTVLALGLLVPLAFGALDLQLRWATP